MANESFTKAYFLKPGECNAEKELPIWRLVDNIIEVASLHANLWGVGYERLIADNQAWVLSRLAIEMDVYPKVNETYHLTTWIQGYNRHFSERNVEITNAEGKPIGYARTIWSVINLSTRQSCDISELQYINENVLDKECPITSPTKIRLTRHDTETRLVFQYGDVDFNRHINSIRYIYHIMNQWPLSFHDKYQIARFEISYLAEGHAGENVTIGIERGDYDNRIEIVRDKDCLCRSTVKYKDRE